MIPSDLPSDVQWSRLRHSISETNRMTGWLRSERAAWLSAFVVGICGVLVLGVAGLFWAANGKVW